MNAGQPGASSLKKESNISRENKFGSGMKSPEPRLTAQPKQSQPNKPVYTSPITSTPKNSYTLPPPIPPVNKTAQQPRRSVPPLQHAQSSFTPSFKKQQPIRMEQPARADGQWRLAPPEEEPFDNYLAPDEDLPVDDMTSAEIEGKLVLQDREEKEKQIQSEEEKHEFIGGKTMYDRNTMSQPVYDEPTMQILNDTAADESFPVMVQYISQLSHLGRQAQARMIARCAVFQSKNQVLSNIQNQNDFQMAQDDFAYVQILSSADFSSYDTNADYFTAQALLESSYNIRLRRSKGALNLLQFNTQRSESYMGNGSRPGMEEQQKLRSKIPFLGQYL